MVWDYEFSVAFPSRNATFSSTVHYSAALSLTQLQVVCAAWSVSLTQWMAQHNIGASCPAHPKLVVRH